MAEVFAGFVCGYILALFSTPVLAALLFRLRAQSELLARLLPAGVSVAPLSVLLHVALFFFWTSVGIVLGLVLFALPDDQAALGSASFPFTLLIIAFVLAVFAPAVIMFHAIRQPALLCAVAVLLVFGWLMPHMAGWSQFESDDPPFQLPNSWQA